MIVQSINRNEIVYPHHQSDEHTVEMSSCTLILSVNVIGLYCAMKLFRYCSRQTAFEYYKIQQK